MVDANKFHEKYILIWGQRLWTKAPTKNIAIFFLFQAPVCSNFANLMNPLNHSDWNAIINKIWRLELLKGIDIRGNLITLMLPIVVIKHWKNLRLNYTACYWPWRQWKRNRGSDRLVQIKCDWFEAQVFVVRCFFIENYDSALTEHNLASAQFEYPSIPFISPNFCLIAARYSIDDFSYLLMIKKKMWSSCTNVFGLVCSMI